MTGAKYQSLIESSSIQGGNAAYVEDLYEQYLSDPESVDAEWRAYFRGVQGPSGAADVPHGPVRAKFEKLAREGIRAVAASPAADVRALEKQAAVLRRR